MQALWQNELKNFPTVQVHDPQKVPSPRLHQQQSLGTQQQALNVRRFPKSQGPRRRITNPTRLHAAINRRHFTQLKHLKRPTRRPDPRRGLLDRHPRYPIATQAGLKDLHVHQEPQYPQRGRPVGYQRNQGH